MRSARSEQASRRARRGREAEDLVARWLSARGYAIHARNLHVGRDEVDIVAFDGPTLVLVEVRARGRTSNTSGLESIDRRKSDRLRRCAKRLAAERQIGDVRIDCAAVDDGRVEYVMNAVDFTST